MFGAIWKRIFQPDAWLTGTVTPIPKEHEEDKSHPKANRPITNIAGFCKLFEYMMKTRMKNYFDKENWTSAAQHGR